MSFHSTSEFALFISRLSLRTTPFEIAHSEKLPLLYLFNPSAYSDQKALFLASPLGETSARAATSLGSTVLRVWLPSRRLLALLNLESIFQLSTPLGFSLQSLFPYMDWIIVSHDPSAPALPFKVFPP